MYKSQQYLDNHPIKHVDCMYKTKVILDDFSSQNNVKSELNACESALDAAIASRTLANLENKLDTCLNSLDADLVKQAGQVNSNQRQNQARSNNPNQSKNKSQATDNTKISYGKNKLEKMDFVIQIQPNFNPKMTLQVIKSIADSQKKVLIRQHIHSSICLTEAEAVVKSFDKFVSSVGLKVDREPGRCALSHDFVFTFLITNSSAVKHTHIDLTIHAANYTNIAGDFNISHLLYDLAGGQNLTDQDYYWCDMISEASENTSLLKNVKNVISKNYSNTGGLADVLRALVI